jgi:hypothetical protein
MSTARRPPVLQQPTGWGHPDACRCPSCRRDTAIHATAIGGLLAAGAVIWLATAPLRIWHVTGTDGKMHPVTATYIAYIAAGAVILAVLMFSSIRAAGRVEKRAAEKARIAEALRAAGEFDRGGPRRDLRDVAARNEQQGRPLWEVTP